MKHGSSFYVQVLIRVHFFIKCEINLTNINSCKKKEILLTFFPSVRMLAYSYR